MTSKFGGVEINASRFGGVPVESESPQIIGGQGSRFGGVPLPTAPQSEQTVSPDLKEKIDEAPWYSLCYMSLISLNLMHYLAVRKESEKWYHPLVRHLEQILITH